MEAHCTSGGAPFLRRRVRASTGQPSLSLRVVACACSALARHCAHPLRGTRPSTCASDARARRVKLAILGPCTMEAHCTSEGAPFLRRRDRASTCQLSLSLRVVACACSALARHCARPLRGTRPSTCASDARARRVKLTILGPCTMKGHCTSGGAPFFRRRDRAPTCQPCLSQREVDCACSALARHCARPLRGRGPAHALPTRARRVKLTILGACTMEGHCTSGGAPFLRRRDRFPRASPPSHCAWRLARVARLRATALALSGDEAQHVRFRHARAAPSRRQSVHTLWNGTARAIGRRSFGARPVVPPASLPFHSARWIGRVARLRATALAL